MLVGFTCRGSGTRRCCWLSDHRRGGWRQLRLVDDQRGCLLPAPARARRSASTPAAVISAFRGPAGRSVDPGHPRRGLSAGAGCRLHPADRHRRCRFCAVHGRPVAPGQQRAMRDVPATRTPGSSRCSTSGRSARSSASASRSVRCCRCRSPTSSPPREGRVPDVPRAVARLTDPDRRWSLAARSAARGYRSSTSSRMTLGALRSVLARQVEVAAAVLGGFVMLFVFSGLGNGSTYKMIPAVLRSKCGRRSSPAPPRADSLEAGVARRLVRVADGVAGADQRVSAGCW